MKAVHEMTEVPVMGQRYLVPCVEITADDINVEHTPGQVGRRPMWVNFGEHRDAYAAAWAELSAKGGAT